VHMQDLIGDCTAGTTLSGRAVTDAVKASHREANHKQQTCGGAGENDHCRMENGNVSNFDHWPDTSMNCQFLTCPGCQGSIQTLANRF